MINIITNLIKKAWTGKEKLWMVFWIYFVLVTLVGYAAMVMICILTFITTPKP